MGRPAPGRENGKRSSGVTIGTHRLGINLWITRGRTGENLWLPRRHRLAVPRCNAAATCFRTSPVDTKTGADLVREASSPVSTVPMTTTFFKSIQQLVENPRAVPAPRRHSPRAYPMRGQASPTRESAIPHTESGGGPQ